MDERHRAEGAFERTGDAVNAMRDNGLAMGLTAADVSRLDSLNMLPAHSFGKVTPPSRHRGFVPLPEVQPLA